MEKRVLNSIPVWLLLVLIGIGGSLGGCKKNPYPEGIQYLNDGKYWEATKYYQEKLKADPKNAVLENQLGYSYAKRGKFSDAEQHYNKAIELNPDYPEAYYNLGFLYMQGPQLKFDQAVKEFDQAIKARDDYAKAYSNRGVVEGYLGKFELARKDIEKAVSLEPDNKVFKENLDWLEQMEKVNKNFQEENKAGGEKKAPPEPTPQVAPGATVKAPEAQPNK